MLDSAVCRFEHFSTPWFTRWASALHLEASATARPRYFRKVWEYAAVLQTLEERGFLRPGARGLGFAVGHEPLPALLASYEVDVVATDQAPAGSRTRPWARTGQHAASREELFDPKLVSRARFDAHVSFEHADMNGPWGWDGPTFDFVWSCCAFEHLGSLERGMRFVERSARLLKPGGIAVHTTEYNVSSNEGTVSRGPGVIYRRRDIEALDGRLRRAEKCLAAVDFRAGEHEYDRVYDVPPYLQTPGREHVKLLLDGYVVTSALLTVVG